eukprot:s1678_g8.t1
MDVHPLQVSSRACVMQQWHRASVLREALLEKKSLGCAGRAFTLRRLRSVFCTLCDLSVSAPEMVARSHEKAKESEPDSRLLIERLLLPPGTTLSRAMSTGLFFLMLYCFVWTSWFLASGADPCASERNAADAFAAEVLRLKEELAARQGALDSADQL